MSEKETTGAASRPLAKLIDSEISPEGGHPREAKFILLEEPVASRPSDNAAAAFERSAINFLIRHRDVLGITSVWQVKNARVDAVVGLADGRRLAVEIKFRMNWEKACQACAQIGWFRTRGHRIDGGLVIFEDFTADWAREKARCGLEPGWSYFYGDHHRVEGVRVDLLRLRHGQLESFIDALATRSETEHRAEPDPQPNVPLRVTVTGPTAARSSPEGDFDRPVTLHDMGFAIREDCDQAPCAWRFIAAGRAFLVPSPNGLHLRGVRHYIADARATRCSTEAFIACTITKSYASGGSDGSLDIIDAATTIDEAIASSNRHLRGWISDDEVYLPDLQDSDPEPLDTTATVVAVDAGRALFVGDWTDVDRKAERSEAALDQGPATPGRLVTLYYSNDRLN